MLNQPLLPPEGFPGLCLPSLAPQAFFPDSPVAEASFFPALSTQSSELDISSHQSWLSPVALSGSVHPHSMLQLRVTCIFLFFLFLNLQAPQDQSQFLLQFMILDT